ncbi:MAG: hypothetical protein AAFX93_14075 [Verrucomicrobiota bacterium]
MTTHELAKLLDHDEADIRGIKSLMNSHGFVWPNGEIELDQFMRFVANRGVGFKIYGARRYTAEIYENEIPLTTKELAAELELSERWIQALRRAMIATGTPWPRKRLPLAIVKNWLEERRGITMREMEELAKD